MKRSGFANLIYLMITLVVLFIFSNSQVSPHPFDDIRDVLKKSGIKAEGEERIYEKNQLYEYINGGADIYFEYGFEKVFTQKVSRNDKIFNISIYEMLTDKAAYGILTFSQYEGMDEVEGITFGRLSPGRLIFPKGIFFCMIQSESFDVDSKEDSIFIGRKIDEYLPLSEARVDMDHYLPPKNRVKFSEKLVTGYIGLMSCLYLSDEDVFKLSKTNPGYFAKYDISGKSLSLLVVPMDADRGKDVGGKVKSVFKEKFKETEDVDGNSCFVDKRGRFYSSMYKDGKFMFIYRAKEKGSIKEIYKFFN